MSNFISYLIYGIRNKEIHLIPLFINLVILVVSCFGYKDIINSGDLIAIFFLIVINTGWQLKEILKEVRSYCKTTPLEIVQNVGLSYTLDDSLKSWEYKQIDAPNDCGQVENTAYYSVRINSTIRSGESIGAVHTKQKEKQTKEFILRHWNELKPFLKQRYQLMKSKDFYNERKLCLASEISCDGVVSFCDGWYYSTHLTNKTLYNAKYIRAQDGVKYFPPKFEKNEFMIPNYSMSQYSDEIGVSTIGFTSDGYLFLTRQGMLANAAPELITPTGSGSADSSDYCGGAGGFLNTIIKSTNRELYEECGKPKNMRADSFAKTKVIGFFRWANQCGRPEFLSVSFMNIGVQDITPNSHEQLPKEECICRYIGRVNSLQKYDPQIIVQNI